VAQKLPQNGKTKKKLQLLRELKLHLLELSGLLINGTLQEDYQERLHVAADGT
jgi:hypothetical protein